ncbi:MAG TPA: FKBP-type peptidyl-prolyl cis-trans isomerase [Longimicrobiales bacterium]|nr:FKBP-type peptidyl-prolyl cis-trans isomerase [Longimicrobiales bacterium]
MKRLLSLAAALALGTAACAGAGDAEHEGVAQTYAPELGVDLDRMTRSATGLYIEDVDVGTGETVTAGQGALVHYTGRFATGEEFDTSRDGDPPLEFVIGAGQVIPGWEEGVAGMKVGGRRKLVIPPHLAYGVDGYEIIPPNATLVFDVELVGIRGLEPALPDTTVPDTMVADTLPADTTDHSGH